MSTAKTRVDQGQLESFFHERLHLPDLAYQPIEEGEGSQAYFFESPEGARVLRINSASKEGFLKDEYAAEHFTTLGVPVPRSLEVGELEAGLFFSVSERVPGQLLTKFSIDELNGLMPEFIKTLEAIHAIPPMGEGYGYWQLDGMATYSSWKDAIIKMQTADDDYKLAEVEYFDQALHDELMARAMDLLTYVSDERKLVHGDFGFKNTLSDGKIITGVIDWHSSMYGDPLFDVAWLDFWREKQGYAAQFKQYYEDQGRLPEHFEERIKCYSLLNALSSMAFFAKSGQPEKYEFSKNRLASL